MTDLHGNLARICFFSFLQRMLFPMAIITIFWKEQIGLDLTQILMLQAVFSVVTVLLEFPSGYVSDRIGYRFALNLASILGVLGWGLYTVADSFAGVMLSEILLGASVSFVSGSDSALLYESLRAEGKESLYSRFEGRMNGFAQTGEAVGALFAGGLYAVAPLLPFFLQVGVWIAAFLLTRTLAETTRDSGKSARLHLVEALGVVRYTLVENRHLRNILFLATILCVASFYPVWLIQPYMRQAGVPLTWFGPVWAGANFIVALSALLCHRVVGRIGQYRLIVLIVLLVLGGYLGLGVAGGLWGFLFYYPLTCMRGLARPFLLFHVQAESPSANRAGVISLISLAFRLAFACTAPLVGKLADTFGVQQTFYILLYVFLAVLPFFAFLFVRGLSSRNGKIDSAYCPGDCP